MSNKHLTALEIYRARGSKSLNDSQLEAQLFAQLNDLERAVDNIGPTPLRHTLSDLVVEMRREIWSFDQANSPWK